MANQRVERAVQVCATCGATFEIYKSEVARGGGKFCSLECYRRRARPSLAERFWSKVEKTPDCWLWLGATMVGKWRYGCLKVPGENKLFLAHRLSWELEYGKLSAGQWVLHRCDEPLCVRPDHLFLGDAAANSEDMAKKGRAVDWKLTAEKVAEIRTRYAAGGVTQKQISAEFGIAPSMVSVIVNRKVWRTHG